MKTISSFKAVAGLLTALLIGSFVSVDAAAYSTAAGKLYDANGQEIQLRGVSHYGFNADILQPEFLWSMGWKEQIAQIKSLGFNAVRLPFVPDTLYVTTKVDQLSYVDPNKNPELLGKTPLQVLDLWMAEANRQGLYVLMDFHSVSNKRQYPTWFVDNPADYNLIYNNQAYTEDMWVRDLKFVAARYANLPYFIAIDVYNEPNGVVRWSTGDANNSNPKNFWKPAVEKAAAGILAANPNLLIFVQGITGNYDGVEDSNVPINWGENFRPQSYQPLNIASNKLVFTPHTYGPDVFGKPSFNAPNYPNNLAADWETLFGRFSSQTAIVTGEWGGRYGQGGTGQKDVQWQNAYVDYLLSKGIRSSFYWCYTPNSGDTGGILDDNLNVRTDKMALLQRAWGPATSSPPATSPPPPASPPPSPPPLAPTPPPSSSTLALSASSYTVAQSAGSVTLKVNRTNNSNSTVSVTFATGDGSAKSGVDYTARALNLRWVAGDTSAKSVVVYISKTTPFSGSKNFTVTLSNAAGGAVTGAPASATVTINGSKATSPPPPPAPAPTTNPQQSISSFSPSSGAVGTVVTLIGSGFTGSNAAWAGNAHDAGLTVVSDTQARITIPADATSGALAILNPAHAAFTATSFTVTVAKQTYVQPYIQSFSPASGPVGTVVTILGSGFTGSNEAWVGNAHGVAVTVVSDTQVKVTIPANATSGAIGIFNPAGVSFTASSFTVQ